MAQYIDKSAIVAGIEKLSKEWSYGSSAEAKYRAETYKELIDFLDNLEVEDVDEIVEDAKDTTMRDLAWKVHVMISEGKSISEIDHYVCGVCDF